VVLFGEFHRCSKPNVSGSDLRSQYWRDFWADCVTFAIQFTVTVGKR
jgi:hypothetical protein